MGLLPPNWITVGAVYLGGEHVDGFDCYMWTKEVATVRLVHWNFFNDYEKVATVRPVHWNFFNGRPHSETS
uniref:Uncharacterized protein n=1 Tax=Sorghum bicolor TaxID=4558 RepID=C6JRZ3_SORBI